MAEEVEDIRSYWWANIELQVRNEFLGRFITTVIWVMEGRICSVWQGVGGCIISDDTQGVVGVIVGATCSLPNPPVREDGVS